MTDIMQQDVSMVIAYDLYTKHTEISACSSQTRQGCYRALDAFSAVITYYLHPKIQPIQ